MIGGFSMQITLRNQEIAASIKALDFYSRIFIGQYGEIDFVLRQYRLGHEVDSQYEYARRQIYTGMRSIVFNNVPRISEWDLNGSLGIWSEDTDERAKNAYDMQQVIRYHDSWCRVPEGGTGRHFDEPLFGGNLSPIKCKCVMDGKDEVMHVDMIKKEHMEILIASIEISLHLHQINIRKMMEYYTDDARVFALAKVVEKLYDDSQKNNNEYTLSHIKILKKLLRVLKKVEECGKMEKRLK